MTIGQTFSGTFDQRIYKSCNHAHASGCPAPAPSAPNLSPKRGSWIFMLRVKTLAALDCH